MKPTGLAVAKQINLEVIGAGFTFEFLESNIQTLTPDVDLVVPLAITAATASAPTLDVLVRDALSGEVLIGTNTSTIHNPAIVVGTVTVPGTPPNFPAGQVFGVMAQIDVTDYTIRNVSWSSNYPELVTIIPNEFNALSAMVTLDAGLAVGTKVTLTCSVDDVAGSSADINIIEA